MQRSFTHADGLAVIAAVGLLCFAAQAQESSITTHLLGRVDSRRATEGAPFFVKTAAAWKEGGCSIPGGATLEGRIARVQRKGSGGKREEMNLRFLPIPCSGDEAQELIPILVAMQAAHNDAREEFIAQQELVNVLSSSVRHVFNASGSPDGASSDSAPGALGSGVAGHLGNLTPTSSTGPPLRFAEVRGIPGVKLSLPTLTSESTALSSSRAMLIDPGTRFLLGIEFAPKPASPSIAVHTADASVPVAKPVAPAAQEVEIERCVETGCASAESPVAVADNQIERRLSLRAFGFRERSSRVLRSLVEDAAVRFLGEDQLLITFNAHPLITRSQEEAARFTGPRIIRALLLSVKTGKVIRAEDWRVPDDRAYVWPLDGGRVLAHVGGELAVYGPGLVRERQWWPLGDVRFLRVAPSRHLIVVAVTHERHTPEEHRRLADFLGPMEPVEEDLDLTVLDDRLNVQSNRRLEHTPVLSEMLDTGVILSERGVRESWTVSETTWDGERRQIVRVDSPCPLRVETLPTNLIFLIGCSSEQTHSWYRILRPNGKTLLRGTTSPNGWLEHADAPTGAGVFAVAIAEASHPVDFTQGIVASDFQNFAVSVYRIADGHRLYEARSANGAVNRQSFALSDSGRQLAILSGEDVSLYRIGEPRAASEASVSH